MFKKLFLWCWLLGESIGFPLAWREAEEECCKLRRQRDCLYRHFNILAEKYFEYEKLPEDLVEVLNEIEYGYEPPREA